MFQFGTKAETLESLRPHLKKARICPSIVFTVEQWHKEPGGYLERIRQEFAGRMVIVRSSAVNEDSVMTTMAGTHASLLDICADSADALSEAIARVIRSYRKSDNSSGLHHQVLVQPMVTEVSMSGVVFTRDLNTGGPYYVINYDDTSGKTDAVTSGTGDTSRTLLIHRGSLHNIRSTRFRALMEAVVEIEHTVAHPGLDIEFAVTRDEAVHILQVRRLAVQETWNRETAHRVDAALDRIRLFLQSRFKPVSGVLGSQSVFGVMPDWNPIEMIGAVPRRLARSLYQYLITDSVWAEARAAMGYRDVSGRPLMVAMEGRVYIDVRESFNSFLPRSLPDSIGEKLVCSWLDRLQRHPELHDKIEFEVATTLHAFDFDSRVKPALLDGVLSAAEASQFAGCLLDLTNRIVGPDPDIIGAQLRLIDQMQDQRLSILSGSAGADAAGLLRAVQSLLEDCKNRGTRPFSILARCGFMAEDFLRSLVRTGLLSAETAAGFRRSVKTVVSDFLDAVHGLQDGTVDKEAFFNTFGHLRPGTYDILSKRYDQRETLNSFTLRNRRPRAAQPEQMFALSEQDQNAIDRILEQSGCRFTSTRLFAFMRGAIAGREYAKLKFTQNLSDALEMIARWGAAVGLSREELSHIAIGDLLGSPGTSLVSPRADTCRALAHRARDAYRVSQAIRLPFLITCLADVDVIPLLKSRPNFITQKSIRSPGVFISAQDIEPGNLDGHIVLIESADPGYDWIFMHRVEGLVTKYGGANSHMAIRCAELDIPAAIGCGEQLFARLVNASEISLDCGAEHITPIN